jgi:hypothetical protein
MAGALSLRHLNLSASRLPPPSISQRMALRQFEQWRATANPYAPGLHKISAASRRAASLFGSGDASAAEPHAREAEDAARTLLGSQHPRTLSCMLELGNIVVAQGKTIYAEPLAKELVASCRAVLGTKHLLTINAIIQLSAVEALQHQYGEAEQLLREAVASSAAACGMQHPTTRRAASSLTKVIAALGRSEAAAARMEWEGTVLAKAASVPPRASAREAAEAEAKAALKRAGLAQPERQAEPDQEGRLKMMEVLAGLQQ